MLSREEVQQIESYQAQERIKWLSFSCVDENAFKLLLSACKDMLKRPNNKGCKEKVEKAIQRIQDRGVYSVDEINEKLEELDD